MSRESKPSVLITGCSSGIGNALAREYHSKGFIVFATARRLESMSNLDPLLSSGTIHLLKVDVSDIESIRNARDKVAEVTGGKLNVLINNAGQGVGTPAVETPLEDIHKLFAVNLFGVMAVTQEFSHLLIASGKGQILNMGSVLGLLPMPFTSAYSASKAALHAYSSTLRVELKPFNVDVITVVAGGIETNIVADPIRALPSDSLYASVDGKKMWNNRAPYMAAETFAERLVKRASSSNLSGTLSIGTNASFLWFLTLLLPAFLLHRLMAWNSGLDQLKGRLESQKKDKDL